MAKEKLRKKQEVIDDLAKATAEGYAARSLARQYDNQINSLQYELDKIIQEELSK